MSEIVTHADICGRNPVLAASLLGCGKPILTCAEVYRCVNCQTPFHKDCLHRHCENERTILEARALKAEAERDGTRKEWSKFRAVLFSIIPQTYGEAVVAGWIPDIDQIPGHEWDNRTTEENAAWVIERLRAKLDALRAEIGKG